jgi:hypothetical protein
MLPEPRDNGCVRMPTQYIHQPPVDKAIETVRRQVPGIVRIRYSLDSDWTGDPSIFFRILLSDAASRPGNHLREIAQRVTLLLMNEVRSEEFGLHAYFNFRSESEQKALRESDWE